MRKLLFFMLLSGGAFIGSAQITYVTPNHMYNTFNEVTNSARAEALGKNTVTLNGLRSAFDNPAAISPGQEKAQLAFNFLNGHPYHLKSRNYFFGFSYKVTSRVTIGISTHQWVDPEGTWTAIIANTNTPTEKKSQHTYSLHAAGRIGKYLHIGISGNNVSYKAIEGLTTSKTFLLNGGLVYDRPVKWLGESRKASNESLRLALGFTNLLFKGTLIERKDASTWQYRDVPIIMRLGAAYGFTVPLKTSVGSKTHKIKELPKTLDLSARIQYNNWLKQKDHFSGEAASNTLLGIGLEATALQLVTARLGYFKETRPTRDEPGEIYATRSDRKGLTWGLGFQVPAKLWSGNKWPFDIRFDILAKNHPNTLNENISMASTKEFTDKKLFFGLGFELNF